MPFLQLTFDIGKADPATGLIGTGGFGLRFVGMPVINSFDDDTYRLGGTFNGGFDILSDFSLIVAVCRARAAEMSY